MSGAVKDPLRALQGARSRAQGGQLEERIEASCTRLAEAGRADISKTPEPMRPVSQPNKTGQFRAVYTKKAEPDFKGVMLGGRAVMFEAKSTGTGRLNKDRVLPEQAKKLDSYEALGAHCFIVATFDGLRIRRLPAGSRDGKVPHQVRRGTPGARDALLLQRPVFCAGAG